MTKPDDPAFVQVTYLQDITQVSGCLTKREYFAAMAMQGLLGCDVYLLGVKKVEKKTKIEGQEIVSAGAVLFADAIIAELNKPHEGL